MTCPRCGFDQQDGTLECLSCGIIFAKWQDAQGFPPVVLSPRPTGRDTTDDDDSRDGRIGKPQVVVLAVGLMAALVIRAIPGVRLLVRGADVLFHELGHTMFKWLFGYPAVPSWIHGATISSDRSVLVMVAIYAAFAWLTWTFRRNLPTLVVLALLIGLHLLLAFTRGHSLIISFMGHGGEVFFAGIFFYTALTGFVPYWPDHGESERKNREWRWVNQPLAAMIAFYVQIEVSQFGLRLILDPDYRAAYEIGRVDLGIWNDFHDIALEWTIMSGINPGTDGVARFFLAFAFLAPVTALAWYLNREKLRRIVNDLLVAERQ